MGGNKGGHEGSGRKQIYHTDVTERNKNMQRFHMKVGSGENLARYYSIIFGRIFI